MGKPRRKVRQRSIEWFERDCSRDAYGWGGVLQGCSGPLSRHFSAPTSSLGRFSMALDVGGKICSTTYFCFILLCTCSSPCRIKGSVCHVIFFYKFNCTDPGLQLGDPAPLIGLLLWTCWYFIYFSRTLTEFKNFSRRLLKFKTFSRVHESWLPSPTHWQAKIRLCSYLVLVRSLLPSVLYSCTVLAGWALMWTHPFSSSHTRIQVQCQCLSPMSRPCTQVRQ